MKNFIWIIGLFIFFTSCKEKTKFEYKSNVIGGLNELLVVGPGNFMKTTTGDTIQAIFEKPTEGIYEYEPSFILIPVQNSSIKSFLKSHRSILHVVINEKAKNKLFIEKNKWSYTQCYARVEATNDSVAAALIAKNSKYLFNYYKIGEYKRIGSIFKKHPNKLIQDLVKKKFGINFYTSVAFRINKPQNNPTEFVWISNENAKTTQGFFIYSLDYTDIKNFSISYFLSKRDSLLKKHIAGPSENSYMTTEKKLPLEIKNISIDDTYAVKVNGFWMTTNDFMGGPFFIVAFPNKEHTKIIVLDAYIYSPAESKRNLLTELEAIVNMVEFTENPKES